MADFWATVGNTCCSEQIKKLLANKDCTIEEIFDDDEFLQEVTTNNDELIQFLSRDEIFTKIIDFIIVYPDELEHDYKRCFKYPFWACELLDCKNKDLLNLFYGVKQGSTQPSNELSYKFIDKLFSIIHSDQEIDNTTCGYFLRVITV